MIHLEVPSESSALKRLYYDGFLKGVLYRAACVFTDSTFSRERIIDWSGLDPDRVVVTGCGVTECFFPGGRRRQHHRPYLLFVGNLKPHKNLDGLLLAFRDAGLSSDFDLLLPGYLDRRFKTLVGQLGLDHRILGLGPLSDPDLAALYRGATALVVPSFYEGFGLPVAEALACGTPVLSSRLTSLPEVGGLAVRYFDPHDHEEFVETLKAVKTPEALQSLKTAGLLQARQHNWDTVAQIIRSKIEGRCSKPTSNRED